jgi:uncharacterized protein (TIGR02996 family)
MSVEEGFIRAVLKAPEDEARRLVYADWLEERGDCRGEYLRVQVELLRFVQEGRDAKGLHERYKNLRSTIDPNWVTLTDWPIPDHKFSILCALKHSWKGCVCRRCGIVSEDLQRHVWVGCRCIRCGTIKGLSK